MGLSLNELPSVQEDLRKELIGSTITQIDAEIERFPLKNEWSSDMSPVHTTNDEAVIEVKETYESWQRGGFNVTAEQLDENTVRIVVKDPKS